MEAGSCKSASHAHALSMTAQAVGAWQSVIVGEAKLMSALGVMGMRHLTE